MNDDDINTELQEMGAEALAQPEFPPPLPFSCDICGQGFKNMNAVRMHKVRVHTEAGRQGALKGARNAHHGRVDNFRNREEHLAHRREYQKKLRERYKATGRDSRGYPRKKNQPQWSPEQRAKFMRTLERRKRVKQKQRNKQIRYVYPEPETQSETPVKQPTQQHELNYCPKCGTHLNAYQVLVVGLNE